MKNTESMARTLQDSSSKRHFHWTNKVGNQEEEDHQDHQQHHHHPVLPTFKSSSSSSKSTIDDDHHHEQEKKKEHDHHPHLAASTTALPDHQLPRRKVQAAAVSRLRSVLSAFSKNRSRLPLGLGPQVVGTLFGSRSGHVHFALQRDPTLQPAFLIELSTPISGLVREMASGLVRIALECDKDHKHDEKQDQKKKEMKGGARLLEEPVWRTFCNGKKYGFASKRECGPKEWKVLKAVEPISMGAGVLPAAAAGDEGDAEGGSGVGYGELMYMRAKFERVVGSRDSEAFYMMNPDSNGAPELSIYLLRV